MSARRAWSRSPRVCVFALAAAILALGAPGHAQDSPPGPQDTGTVVVEETRIDVLVRDIASQLRCVVCQGLSLQDSPSSLAQEMRGVIRERLEAGETPEQVKDYFVRSYGEWILLEPTARGFNLAVYLLPLVAVIGGAALVTIVARRWLRAPAALAPGDPVPAEPDPELAPWE